MLSIGISFINRRFLGVQLPYFLTDHLVEMRNYFRAQDIFEFDIAVFLIKALVYQDRIGFLGNEGSYQLVIFFFGSNN